MTATTLNVLFKKQQKDDKKEVLKFEYKGKDDDKEGVKAPVSLYGLSGEMVNLKIDDCEWVPAEFAKLNKDSKKVTLDFNIKGDSLDKTLELYKKAGHNVSLVVEPQQTDLTKELPAGGNDRPHEGIEYELDLTNGQVATKSKVEEPKIETTAEEQLKKLNEEPADPEEFGDGDSDADDLPY